MYAYCCILHFNSFFYKKDWAEFKGSEIFEQPSAPFFEDKLETTTDNIEDVPISNVVADETMVPLWGWCYAYYLQTHCPICHEAFESFWDTEQEEWMYRATVVNSVDGKITHQKCLSNTAHGSADVVCCGRLVVEVFIFSQKNDHPLDATAQKEVKFFPGIDDLSY